MAEPTRIQKHHYLLIKFFGTTDTPKDDVNPYDSVGVFRRSRIDSLRWGNTPPTISNSKDRAARRLHEVVALDGVSLDEAAIRAGLDKNASKIDDVVFAWAGKAKVSSQADLD